eukprot:9631220-Alexandrium_andersonii.AAC.1
MFGLEWQIQIIDSAARAQNALTVCGRAPRVSMSATGGEAIIAGCIRARVPVAVVGTEGLCMGNERLAH